jgi:flavin-dependent dehydrogenase
VSTPTRPLDVVVAGGGPVGLAAALMARRAGLSVVVVEPRPDPVDKACGEGLMPGAVHRLAALGVHPPGWPFQGIRYLDRRHVATARFAGGPGLGVRRTALHAALAEAADGAGVVRLTGRVDEIHQGADAVTIGDLRARWLLAADGLHSATRRTLGLDRPPRQDGPARFGLRRHFAVAPWSDYVEVHWAGTAEAYVTPVGPELVGVALLCGPGASYDERLACFPALAERLSGAGPASSVAGAGPLRQVASGVRLGRVLLVGDAAGYVDALTGEGIAVGLESAAAAVSCLVEGRPDRYDAAWRRVSRRYRWLTTGLLAASRRPRVRAVIVPAAAHVPGVFRATVNLLGGHRLGRDQID